MYYCLFYIKNLLKPIIRNLKVIIPFYGMILLIGLFFSAPSIAAASENEKEPVLIAIFSDDLKPWNFIVDGNIEGVYPAIIKELANELNIRVELRSYPLKRCEAMMEQGEADLMIGLKDTPLRKQYIEFLHTPYRLSSAKVFYVRTGERNRLKSYNALYKLRVGTELGTKYFHEFDEDKKIIKEYVKNEEQNFYKLIARRIDVLIIPEDRGEFLVSTLNIRDKVEKASYRFPDGSPRYIGISKKSSHVKDIKRFNTAMSKIVNSGELENLYMKHFFNKYNIHVDSFRWR